MFSTTRRWDVGSHSLCCCCCCCCHINLHNQVRGHRTGSSHSGVEEYQVCTTQPVVVYFFSQTSTFQLLDKPWSQVSSLLPPGSCLQFLSRIGFSNPTARRFFIALCASQLVHKKKSPRCYTSMHSGGFELTKLIYTRLEDNLIRHRGDRYVLK